MAYSDRNMTNRCDIRETVIVFFRRFGVRPSAMIYDLPLIAGPRNRVVWLCLPETNTLTEDELGYLYHERGVEGVREAIEPNALVGPWFIDTHLIGMREIHKQIEEFKGDI